MIAYLVLAHNQPLHLERLLAALDHPGARTFVHIDKKTDPNLYRDIDKRGSVWLEDRFVVHWGHWSQIEATLALLRTALEASGESTHFALLSGSDFPIRPAESLMDFLSASGADHINRIPFPNEERGKPSWRLATRRWDVVERQTGLRARAVRLVNRALAVLPDYKLDQILGDLQVFAGSQWWVLTRASVNEILEIAPSLPGFLSLAKRSVIPDEMYFQTLISARHSPKMQTALTFFDWTQKKSSPAVVTREALESVKASNFRMRMDRGAGEQDEVYFFARKFDESDEAAYEFALELIRG